MRRYAVTYPKGDRRSDTFIVEGETARKVLWRTISNLRDLGYPNVTPATVAVRRLPAEEASDA